MKQVAAFTGIFACLFLSACSNGELHEPLPQSGDRPTPLHYGLKVSTDPAQNPIDPPERFAGYHAATDFEVSADELEKDVPVFAICTGKITYSAFAEGYGGLVTQQCKIQGEKVTVLYGHLSLSPLPKKGSTVKSGVQLGVLAPARTHDSDGNRKHLHLGIVHGWSTAEIRGYVQTEEELKKFVDPKSILPEGFFSPITPNMVPYWKEVASGSELE